MTYRKPKTVRETHYFVYAVRHETLDRPQEMKVSHVDLSNVPALAGRLTPVGKYETRSGAESAAAVYWRQETHEDRLGLRQWGKAPPRPPKCKTCNGDGYLWQKCDECNGRGYFVETCYVCEGDGCANCDHSDDVKEDCDVCWDGTLQVSCPDCGGTGYESKSE